MNDCYVCRNGCFPLCYICKNECFHYLSIVWCMNEECENFRENQNDADLPHHIITFADAYKKG